jgi:hypothetical protein
MIIEPILSAAAGSVSHGFPQDRKNPTMQHSPEVNFQHATFTIIQLLLERIIVLCQNPHHAATLDIVHPT